MKLLRAVRLLPAFFLAGLSVAPVAAQGKPFTRSDQVARASQASQNHWGQSRRFVPAEGFGPFNLLGATSYTLAGFGADSIAVADMNGDGKLDLVVSNACQSSNKLGYCLGSGQISVLLGNGRHVSESGHI